MSNALRWTGVAAGAAFVWCVAATGGLVAMLGLWHALDRVEPWALPLQWIIFALHYRNYHGVPHALLWSGAGATLLAGACIARAATGTPRSSLHGRAWWLGRREAGRGGFSFSLRPRPDSLILGAVGIWPFRLFAGLPGEEHAALTARTGAGKGVSFVVPNAQNTGGALVSFSVKRDVYEAAAAERVRKGDTVRVFDIGDPQRRTHRWNPLGFVRQRDEGTYGDIRRAMFFLIPESKAPDPFWENAGRRLATALGVLLAETPGMRPTVGGVLRLIQRPDFAEHLEGMIEAARNGGYPYSTAAADVLLGFLARRQEREAQSVRENMLTALDLWNDPVVDAATADSDFDLATLRSERLSLFVCAGPADLRLYRPVYGLLFQQLVQLNTRVEFGRDQSHRHRVLGLLDEFWALGKQDVLADAAAFTRSFGFRWAYVQQTRDQSESAFGEAGARNLFNNTGAEIVFGGTDRRTAEDISKRMGDDTVLDTSRSRPRFMGWLAPGKQSENEAAKGRALALPQEVMRLPSTIAIVLRPGLMPLKLRRIQWFRDPWFRPMGGEAPPVPVLAVTVPREDVAAIRADRQRQAEAASAAEAAQRREAVRHADAAARAKTEKADEKERLKAAKVDAAVHARAGRAEAAERRRAERTEVARTKAETKRADAERQAETKHAAAAQAAERQAEAERVRAQRRLAQLRAAQRGAAAGEAVAVTEARDAVAKAAAATEAARVARSKSKGGDAAAAEEAARLAVVAGEATEAARQAKQRASAATRDAQAAWKRLEAFAQAFEETYL